MSDQQDRLDEILIEIECSRLFYDKGKNSWAGHLNNREEAKAQILAWHKEECLRVIGEDEAEMKGDKHLNAPKVRNAFRAELRASLEEDHE